MHTAAPVLKTPAPDTAPIAGRKAVSAASASIVTHVAAVNAVEFEAPPARRASDASPQSALNGGSAARITLASLVAVAHLAALGALARFGMQDTTPPQIAPIQVALIQAEPAAMEQPASAAPAEPEPPPPPEVRPPEPAPPPPPPPEPKPKPTPKPKPVAKKPTPKPVVRETPPATDAPTATSTPTEAAPQPAPVASASASTRSESTPALTQARYDAAYLNNPHPAYPMVSRRMREEGQVMLRVLVSAEGLPSRIELRTSSGSSRLDRAAQDAVARWRFVPARRGSAAVEAWVLVPIVFKLQGN
ncbi:MAG: energy transducer TonB [Thauera sp.]|jgi:protein TonB|nr:energy transducer TonB [Thauera sp.]